MAKFIIVISLVLVALIINAEGQGTTVAKTPNDFIDDGLIAETMRYINSVKKDLLKTRRNMKNIIKTNSVKKLDPASMWKQILTDAQIFYNNGLDLMKTITSDGNIYGKYIALHFGAPYTSPKTN